MTRTPYALLRIPLVATYLLVIAILSVPLPVRAEDREAETVNVAPTVRVLEIGYPYWYHPSVGGNQDAFKFGDKTTIWIELEDYALISSVTVDGSEVGGDSATPIPFSFDRTSTWHVYQMPYTINSHANGLAHIRITATNSLGKSVTLSHEVLLDNVPAEMQIDSFSFVHASTTPAMGDPMLLSGSIGTGESKLHMYDAYYTLYGTDRSPFLRGSFQGTPEGLSLSPLRPGTFTNFQVLLTGDATGGFRMAEPDAAFVSITAVLRDGAGNDTYATSPLISIPHTGVPPSTDPPAPDASSVSNVLFLPGIEGSRLYVPGSGCTPAATDCASEQVWNPSGDSDIHDLYLTSEGISARTDLYTKQRDIISNISIFKFYASFIEQMDGLKASGVLTDWEPVAYDWRLSLGDLVTNGALHGDRINYAEATDTPYIEQTLRRLAASSKTGKVTIIAHSNGGLVAKELLRRLGDQSASLVDTVIFIGVPQSGAPEAFAGLLHGYGTALPADWCAQWKIIGTFCSSSTSRALARAFAENAPMAYHLLPTITYFADVIDALHPLIKFTSVNAFGAERARYGNAIQSEEAMDEFAVAQEGGRTKPATSDIVTPNILNATLLAYARQLHQYLDAWTPPPGITLYQVGGWGVDTLSGIEYYDRKKATGGTSVAHRPLFIEDGDGTVPVPSALMLPPAPNVTSFWFNLAPIALRLPLISPEHATLLEIPEIRTFIQNILDHHPDTLPQYFSTTSPKSLHPKKKLLFVIHGPAALHLYDSTGRHTGTASDGTNDHEIPASTYGQLGDARYALALAGEPYRLLMRGTDVDDVSVDLQELLDDQVIASTTFADMQVTASTSATLTITDGIADASSLSVDQDGDGIPDLLLHTDGTIEDVPHPSVPIRDTGGSNSHSHHDSHAAPEVPVKPVIASSTNQPPRTKPIPVTVPTAPAHPHPAVSAASTTEETEDTSSTSSPGLPETTIELEQEYSSNAATVVLAGHGFFYKLWHQFLSLLQSLFAFIASLFT